MSTDYSDNNYGTQGFAQPDRAQINTSVNLGGHSGAYNANQGSKHISELDIAKIVAQKYAKLNQAEATTNYSG